MPVVEYTSEFDNLFIWVDFNKSNEQMMSSYLWTWIHQLEWDEVVFLKVLATSSSRGFNTTFFPSIWNACVQLA